MFHRVQECPPEAGVSTVNESGLRTASSMSQAARAAPEESSCAPRT